MNEFGNSKFFELYLIFYCHSRGTTMATEVVVVPRLYQQMIWRNVILIGMLIFFFVSGWVAQFHVWSAKNLFTCVLLGQSLSDI